MLHVVVCCAVVSVSCSLVVASWERADLLAVVFVVVLFFVTFPIMSYYTYTSEFRERLAS